MIAIAGMVAQEGVTGGKLLAYFAVHLLEIMHKYSYTLYIC